jgi:alkanesulfonate monooxygenase
MIELHWGLPSFVDGDSRALAPDPTIGDWRSANFDYLTQITRAVDQLGFDGMLLPTGTNCEDAWILASALISHTKRLKFLVAIRPGLMSPTLAAQMIATFQRLSDNRLMLNVVSGSSDVEQRRFGDFYDKATRYERTSEFLDILFHASTAEPYDYKGTHYQVEQATTHTPPAVFPKVYFGGSSEPAEPVAAKQVDVWLTQGEPPATVRQRVTRMKSLAAAQGRQLRVGVSVVVITRDRANDAWSVANRNLENVSAEKLKELRQVLARNDSEAQRRTNVLRDESGDLVVSPNLWSGVGLFRGGAGTALVGSHSEVAERLMEYHDCGVDEFILHGYPHLEEAYWIGEGVMPILRREGVLRELPPIAEPTFRRTAAAVL